MVNCLISNPQGVGLFSVVSQGRTVKYVGFSRGIYVVCMLYVCWMYVGCMLDVCWIFQRGREAVGRENVW